MAKSSKAAAQNRSAPPRVPPRKGANGRAAKRQAPARGGQVRQAQHRRNRAVAWLAVAAVVVVIGVVVGLGVSSGGSGGAPRKAAPAQAIAKLTSIPMSTLTAAAPDVKGLFAAKPINDSPLTANGKPEVLYIGAEFCPICATERWPMLVALSHFGTFSGVKQTHSALRDGDIATLSFYGSTFTSPYLTFTPVETTTNQPQGDSYKLLEKPTPAQEALWAKYVPQGTIPFVDIGGKYVITTAQFPDTVLSGMSFDSIVDAIGHNDNTVGAAVDASAAALTKYFCTLTGQQPAKTCQAVAGVTVPGSTAQGPSSNT